MHLIETFISYYEQVGEYKYSTTAEETPDKVKQEI
jgi:mannose/cellobiose epimerase-like protein (N-acyl-D-glucosamine 2-epimerase family)